MWPVVTGCTAGVGEQYAYNLAAKNMNLLLVSRSKSKLERVAAKIGKDTNILKLQKFEGQIKNPLWITSGSDYPTVEVEFVAVDFSEGRNLFSPESALAGALKDKDVGILVNNVGVITKYAIDYKCFLLYPSFCFNYSL